MSDELELDDSEITRLTVKCMDCGDELSKETMELGRDLCYDCYCLQQE